MKILVIWRLLTVGGVNAGWRNRAIYFKKYGIDMDFLYTTDHGGLHIMQDVGQVYLTKDKKEIRSIIRNNGYDLIIVVDTGSAYEWIRKSNYPGPVLVEARTPELLKLQPHLPDLSKVMPVVMVTPSEFEKRLISIMVEGLPIRVIYNGIDTSHFRPLAEEEIDFGAEPIFPKGKKIVGWVGRLDKRKNWRLLLKIAKVIRRERNDIEFWVIGGAQSVEKDLFSNTWQEQKLEDVVKWFPVIPYQQMPHIYAKIRLSGGCFLATTRAESFGNTFIESMACGVPVIAPNVSSIPEIIIDGQSGYLYRDEHVRGAIRRIYRLLDNLDKYTEMSALCVKRVEERFSIPIVGETYVQLIQHTIQEHQARVNGVTSD